MSLTTPYSRRSVLRFAGVVCGAALPFAQSFAMGKHSLLGIAVLQGLCTDSKRDSGMEKLMWEAEKRTSMKTDETPRRIRITDSLLYEHPLVVLSGSGELKALTESELSRLRHFLKLGGTLFVDDASAMGDERFDRSFRALMKRLWPESLHQCTKAPIKSLVPHCRCIIYE